MIVSDEIKRFRNLSSEKTHVDSVNKEIVDTLIKSTQRELKCLSYKLSTVISDGNYHNLIEEGQLTRIEVIEDTLVYCKIGCKYKYSPMKLRFKYDKKENLKVYISTTNKMPNQDDCEMTYQRPRTLALWAPGRNKKFTKDYFYLALWWSSQVSVDILVTFNTMEKALGKKKLEQVQIEESGDDNRRKILTEAQERILESISKSVHKSQPSFSKNHIKK